MVGGCVLSKCRGLPASPSLYQQNHSEGERGIRPDGSAHPEGKGDVPDNPSQENSREHLPHPREPSSSAEPSPIQSLEAEALSAGYGAEVSAQVCEGPRMPALPKTM